MDSAKPQAGGVPMVNIDGAAIRRIREEKGLTQLYVATVVGVTTDTISRWENRRYPNIKKENALKLAEALETPLAEIIDHGQTPPPTEPPPSQDPEPSGQEEGPAPLSASEAVAPETPPTPELHGPQNIPALKLFRLASRPVIIMLSGLTLLALIGIGLFVLLTEKKEDETQVTSYRVLPTHATPGIPFPVLIDVSASASKPFSLILKETLPPNCIPAQGKPQFVAQAGSPPVLKWIDKLTGEHAVYSYLVRIKPEAKMGTRLKFTGGVTVRSDNNPSIPVTGPDNIEASPFHWADDNNDGHIDDEELLSVYETYGDIEGLRFGLKLIEDIWSGKGYLWNPKTRTYDIIR